MCRRQQDGRGGTVGGGLLVHRLSRVWEARSVREGPAGDTSGKQSMSRFLFVVPPLTGHVNPALGIARALAERGHDVAWAGSERLLRPMLGPDATVYQTGMRPFRGQGALGAAAVKSLWVAFAVPLLCLPRDRLHDAGADRHGGLPRALRADPTGDNRPAGPVFPVGAPRSRAAARARDGRHGGDRHLR